MNRFLARSIAALVASVLVALSGCASIGPGKITSDRTGYNASITQSWKQQILLNVVKIRYVEPLFFVDVGDIVAAYSLETGGNVGFPGPCSTCPAPATPASWISGYRANTRTARPSPTGP